MHDPDSGSTNCVPDIDMAILASTKPGNAVCTILKMCRAQMHQVATP